MTTYWHQDSPYNKYCPNGAGGCGPVAAAQIMAFHKHPAQFGGYAYNWDAMTADSVLTAEHLGANYAARLILDIGVEADAEYLPLVRETGVTMPNMRDAFIEFDYSCDYPSLYNKNRIIENINTEQPVFIGGHNENNKGHIWVIDGYSIYNQYTTYYYTYAPYDVFESIPTSSSTYFHCNLGWGLVDEQIHNNGYYYSGAFLHDDNLKCIYNIMPNE